MKKLLFIITKEPYLNLKSQEILDSILFAASYGFKVDVFFQGKGLQYLTAPPPNKDIKSTQAQIKAFRHFEIESIFVDDNSTLLDKIPKEIKYTTISKIPVQNYDFVIYDELT